MKREIQTTLCITRPSGNRDGYISIQIADEASRSRFFQGEVSLADFASALTGLGYVPMKGIVIGLDHVGKQKVSERRQKLCPFGGYDRPKLEQWLRDNAQEDGWILDDYLGSRDSMSRTDNGAMLYYSVHRFEDMTTQQPPTGGE